MRFGQVIEKEIFLNNTETTNRKEARKTDKQLSHDHQNTTGYQIINNHRFSDDFSANRS